MSILIFKWLYTNDQTDENKGGSAVGWGGDGYKTVRFDVQNNNQAFNRSGRFKTRVS